MKTALVVLLILCMASSVFVAGCSMFVKDSQATSSDGTPLFIGEDGKATAEATNAKGQPNEPLMRSESTGLDATITKAGSSIPGPIGAVIGVVGSLAGAGLAEYLRRKNAATNAAIAEYESKIRAKPEVAAAVDSQVWDHLSPATMTKLLPIGPAKV